MPDDTAKLRVIYYSMLKEINSVNPDTAMVYARVGLNLARKLHAQSYTGKFYSFIANYHTGSGEYEKALEMNLAAVRQFDSIGDSSNVARCIMNSGNVLYHQKKITEAAIYHADALAIYDKLDHQKGMADCYMNLSNDYWELGNKDTSIAFLELSLTLRRELNDQRGIAQSLHNLASSYSEMGEYDKAEKYFREALTIKQNLRDTFSMSFTYVGLGNLAFKQHRFQEAITLSTEAIKLSHFSGNRRVRKEAYRVMASSYAGLGEYKKAFEYQEKYSFLNDSLYTAESDKNISEMKTKYDTDKKEKENQLLQKQNEIALLESRNKDSEIARRDIMVWTAVGGLVIAIVLGLIILKAYRDKRNANIIISAQKGEVELQKSLVEDKQKDILDSINYAKRIQKSFLPSRTDFKKSFRDYFVFNRPRDVVSGDFYTLDNVTTSADKGAVNLIVVTAADCTGHGVPGALMSIVGNTLLNQTIKDPDVNTPADALNFLNRELPKNLMKHEKDDIVRDGMDIVMCAFDLANLKMHSAGAMNSVYVVRGDELIEIKGDRQPISGFNDDSRKQFTNVTTSLQQNDCVYLLTDGYADQFGGPNGKKFKYKQLKDLLVALNPLPMEEQKARLKEEFLKWKGKMEQVDDVLIIGIRI